MTETRTALGLVCGAGIRDSRLLIGTAYSTISPARIAAMVRKPPSVDKLDGIWFLPSSYCDYDAREHEAQRLRGEFHLLVLDIDQGNLSLEAVRNILQTVIGPATYLIYSTKSASIGNRKWRVLVPVEKPVSGQDYEQTASEFMQRMEDASQGKLVLDRSAARTGQVFFLPNRGEYYDFDIANGEGLYQPPALSAPVPIVSPTQVALKQPSARKSTWPAGTSPIQHFNETHDLVDLLKRYGYLRDGQSNHFRSPLQTTESYATLIYPDNGKWVSQSGSDVAAGLGRAKNGYIWGDAFDLYVYFEHAGNFEAAIAAWARYSDIAPAPPTVDLPAPAPLEGSGLAYLQEVLDEHRGDAAYVFAVALRLSSRVPHHWSLEAVREFISGYAEGPVTSVIMHRIESIVSRRKTAALKPSGLGSARIVSNAVHHACEEVGRLTPLSEDLLEKGGVFAIRAPMGSGKTQNVGRPLADWARREKRSLMAIAHRISLVAEMARRLNLGDYRNHPDIDPRYMSVCLPSILKEYAQTRPEVVFIDEILQVLQFLSSKECCRTNEGGPADVFKALCKLIQDAHVVAVADANLNDMCVQYLSFCRPGESINIVEMLPSPTGKVVDMYYGNFKQVRGAVSSLVLKELQAGGKVWLSVESPDLAKTLQQFFTGHDYRVLCAHREVKGQEQVVALLADADFNSRKYDIIIASPVIASGVSIEHRERQHFTLGAYLGGGWVTTPTDALQQLGRVRYLRRFIVGIEQNNLASGGQVWSDEIKGRVAAAKLEQSSTAVQTFDGLIANINATHENARADFGAGLYWHLEAAGWAVHRKEIVFVDQDVSLISKALKEAHHAALIDAGHVDDNTADLLRRMPATEESAIRLEAFAIQQAFAVDVVSQDELSLWADGQFARTIECFEDAFGVGRVELEQTSRIVHRSMRAARRLAYEELLGGIDLTAENWGTRDVVEGIVDRMMLEPQPYVSLGILPKKYTARRQRRDDTYKPIKRPTNVGIVAEKLLTGLGLKATKTRVRADGQQFRVIGTDMGVFARVKEIAERRAARKAAETLDWGDPDL